MISRCSPRATHCAARRYIAYAGQKDSAPSDQFKLASERCRADPGLVVEVEYFGRYKAGCATACCRGSGAIVAGDVITLGEMRAKGMVMLEVACRRFEPRGRLPIERPIAEHSAAMLDLRAVIAADCPRMRNPSTAIYERCGVPRAAALVLTRRRARDG